MFLKTQIFFTKVKLFGVFTIFSYIYSVRKYKKSIVLIYE
ncbi:hypothetical protein JavanS201_0015 [Streptococcus satellite phage Javan201]|nr:hypothetical protein SLUDD06_00118 [Streptococcus lutetiensis]QBX07926.1 hypothetical protein JavanS201_0015 [Streptococcus satellite phage Javan201]QBX07942.1 hypothetical protein JavanS203_0015 [Streptococcus satellite phage Javan203]QBX08702.1 hypothetical protein JavanS287_0012 [Streptococcus satellite phage Javan287]